MTKHAVQIICSHINIFFKGWWLWTGIHIHIHIHRADWQIGRSITERLSGHIRYIHLKQPEKSGVAHGVLQKQQPQWD